jgi:hypothetical protein
LTGSGADSYFHNHTYATTNDMAGLVAGFTYSLSMWIYLPPGPLLYNQVSIQIADCVGGVWEVEETYCANTLSSFQLLTVTKTIRVGSTGTVVRISANNYTGYFYADDINLNYSNVFFDLNDVVKGKISSAYTRVLTTGGDSNFIALKTEKAFTVGENLINVRTGDSSRTLTSLTSLTDKRGLILNIDVNSGGYGVIKVHDPRCGDSMMKEFSKLSKNDVVKIYKTNGMTGDSSYNAIVRSATGLTGDTATITFEHILPGIDQSTSGGYITCIPAGKVKTTTKLNSRGVGSITLLDASGKFRNLSTGDTIKLMSGDTNDGYYIVGDSKLFTRVSGDTAYMYFELGDSMPGITGDTRGIVELSNNYMTLNENSYYGYDSIQFLKTSIT